MGVSRPALAKILIGDATNPVCESVFRSRGHEVDFRPGLSKVKTCSMCTSDSCLPALLARRITLRIDVNNYSRV